MIIIIICKLFILIFKKDDDNLKKILHNEFVKLIIGINYMNYSRQREIILDTLTRNAVHPTAERLLEIIREEQPDSNIGIATVYRNLRKLADRGNIKRISGLEDSEHFDHNTHTHYHFLCNECKRVFDIEENIAPEIIKNTQKQTGFVISDYDIVFHGTCKDCQNKKN